LEINPFSGGVTNTRQYCEFIHVSYQSEASTFSRDGVAYESSLVPIEELIEVASCNRRIPQRPLFGMDYLDLSKMMTRELTKIRADYRVPNSVIMRIPKETESLSNPLNSEVMICKAKSNGKTLHASVVLAKGSTMLSLRIE
ncbi:unnamed protein product, partial [Prunus brigantina]